MSAVRSFIRTVIDWLIVIVIAVVASFALRAFVIEAYVVPSGSMIPTIEIGDHVLGQKVTLELGMGVEAGDIVVFENPDSTSEHDVLIKRVIATEGQVVDLVDGVVYVDGEALDEDYATGASYELASQLAGVSVTYPYTVPEGCVWVMGDNRESSADSRYFGAVSEDSIVAVAFARYWPLDRIGLL